MKRFSLLALIACFLSPLCSLSDTNYFSEGGVFELDLGDSDIPFTPKKEQEQNHLEEQLKKKENK